MARYKSPITRPGCAFCDKKLSQQMAKVEIPIEADVTKWLDAHYDWYELYSQPREIARARAVEASRYAASCSMYERRHTLPKPVRAQLPDPAKKPRTIEVRVWIGHWRTYYKYFCSATCAGAYAEMHIDQLREQSNELDTS